MTVGQQRTVTATWTGLTPGKRYLGVVEYGNGTTALDQTVIQVSA